MKKIASLLTVLILLFGITLTFCACGKTPPTECTEHIDTNGDGICDTEGCGKTVELPEKPSGEYFDEEGGLILFRDGVPTFEIVKGNDTSSVKIDIDNLVSEINKAASGEVNVNGINSEAKPVEILIGTVNTRGDEYKFDKYSLGEKGYIVKIIGTKILVQGGGEASLKTAITYLKEQVFKITKNTPPYADFSMSAELNKENYQTKFDVTSITLMDNDISEYTITHSGDKEVKSVATAFQKALYSATGKYLKIDTKATSGKRIIFTVVENDGEGLGYEVYLDNDANLIFECEYAYLYEELATASYEKLITNPIGKKVTLSKGALDSDDARNLYYEECGAKGDGVTNDFEAIYLAHELANEHGHIVNGTSGATYRIGSTGGRSAVINTDVMWNGCKFVFDDSVIEVHDKEILPCTVKPCPHCADREASVFRVFNSNKAYINVTDKFNGISLKGGWQEKDNTQKIPGWSLDYTALVYIECNELRIFVRTGNNADNGDPQKECILVHPDGTIDPSTPLTYDYPTITKAISYAADETISRAITIDGAGATITTIPNAPHKSIGNKYIQFARNISVERANVTIKNFDHRIQNEGKYRAPYEGIISVSNANNVEFRDITLEAVRRKYVTPTNQQGTYEIGGYASNDIRYYNVDSINFFSDGNDYTDGNEAELHKPGEIANTGTMGTNYCRNFLFNGCTLNTFDAHKGLGNVTLIDSEFHSINMQGSGIAYLENVKTYADRSAALISLRSDYGASWQGDLIIKNCEIRYSKDSYGSNIVVVKTTDYGKYAHTDFTATLDKETGKYITGDGCSNYNPVNVEIDGLKVVKYTFVYVSPSEIIETEVTPTSTIMLYHKSVYDLDNIDISKLESESTNGGGTQCRIIGTKTLSIKNCNVNILVPNSLYFKNCDYTLNGVKMVWNNNSGTLSPWVEEES